MKNPGGMSDKSLERFWNNIDWPAAEGLLTTFQRDIAFAALNRDWPRLKFSQMRLVESIEARALAVRHVCDSVAQVGIDKIKWETGADKMQAVNSLYMKGYKSTPMRLIIVHQKERTKTRYIRIPTYFDRAMQTLHAFALDPVAEVTGDKKSFAFRKGRSMQDLHAYLMRAFEMSNPPMYVIKSDVKACYASISHDWLMNNIRMNRNVLKQFLKSGHVFGGEIFPPDDFGITLGSSISHILGNMTLDGAQDAIYKGLFGRSRGVNSPEGNLIRFADDLLITAYSMKGAERILDILKSFLVVRGLALSDEKTEILKISDGFDFLSRHYRYDGVMYSAPSADAVARMERSLQELISPYRGGQKTLIEKINKKLIGWSSYHKITDAARAFRHIDNVVKSLLLELCERLNPYLTRARIISRYFYREPDGEYIYALENKPDVRVHRLTKTVLVSHLPAAIDKNPYIDNKYYETRTDSRAINNVTGKYKAIWTRQDGKCFYCGYAILKDDKKNLVLIDEARTHHLTNLAYIHEYCSTGEAEFYESDEDIKSRFDLHKFLLNLKSTKRRRKSRNKFQLLMDYFSLRKESVVTLTFKEVEEILGYSLCESALSYSSYWKPCGKFPGISACWLSNGYKIRALDLKKKRVIFERVEKLDSIEIPAFLQGRVPLAARAELKIVFDYVRKKYGL